MHIVKSVGPMSVAKIMGILYGCMGLLIAPFFLMMGMLGSMASAQKNPFTGMAGAVIALLMPFIYGAMGFIMGAIGALLYNLFAKLVGGIELELDSQPQAVAPYPLVPPPTPRI